MRCLTCEAPAGDGDELCPACRHEAAILTLAIAILHGYKAVPTRKERHERHHA